MHIMKNILQITYIEKAKDVGCSYIARMWEWSKIVSHSGFRTDNESINESKMSTF